MTERKARRKEWNELKKEFKKSESIMRIILRSELKKYWKDIKKINNFLGIPTHE